MARKGEDFEPDVLASDDDIDDDNNDHDEDDDEALLAMEHEGGEGDLGGGDIVENGAGGEGKVNDGKKRKRNGGRQRLTRDRVERLDGIGFQWVVANPNTKSWEERFEDLREYQRMNGSTRVPRSGALGEWVHMQVSTENYEFVHFSVTCFCYKSCLFLASCTLSVAFTTKRTRTSLPVELPW